MAKICPKCEREFANSSVKCPICNCGIVKKEDYEVAKYQHINHDEIVKSTGDKTKQEKTKISHSKKKKKKMMIIALCVIGLLAVSRADTGDSKNDNVTSNNNDIGTGLFAKEQDDQSDSGSDDIVNNEILDNEMLLYNAVESVVGKDELLDFVYVSETNYMAITFMASESLTANMIVQGAYLDISEILKSIQPMVDADVYICVKCLFIDEYGNPHEKKVIQADYSLETIQKINFDYFLSENVSTIADSWWNYPTFVIEK